MNRKTSRAAVAQYDLFTHRHNFAVWAAARAAQRSLTNVAKMRSALEKCGVVEFIRQYRGEEVSLAEFDVLHRTWCRCIIKCLVADGVSTAMYGRAAKLIAIYLKSMVIVGGGAGTSLACVAHPPIDEILLKNLRRAPTTLNIHKKEWRMIRWTKLNEAEYFRLIGQLRDYLGKDEPMWKLEEYWTVTSVSREH
jgi:hypothetical protein